MLLLTLIRLSCADAEKYDTGTDMLSHMRLLVDWSEKSITKAMTIDATTCLGGVVYRTIGGLAFV